ncbi:hypothetical protein LCGC14_1529150 [marine sediment metagenome]|uniref:Creatinase N-terminal domain-containing protein n=1 Tax=marine sediment metagenome TaxID=412755 RepID=A0A0F9JH58_9ZZZZ
MQRDRLQSYEGNGPKATPTFSAGEMQRRQDALRTRMAEAGLEAVLLTSYHNINYYADFMYFQFCRRYGLVIDHDRATTISAGIDGGQPWRRSFGANVTYTDWSKDNLFHAVRQPVQVDVAGHGLVPAARHGHKRLLDVLIGQPHRAQVRPVGRPRRAPFHRLASQPSGRHHLRRSLPHN